jgi:CheY-like chemotaxis protein
MTAPLRFGTALRSPRNVDVGDRFIAPDVLPIYAIARRVLVVDDCTDSREACAILIGMLGHVVRTAGDGREALDVAASFSPDLIFLDIGLPELDGFEVCTRLRARPQGTRLIIYALTGFGEAEYRDRAMRVGFDAHFVKPLDPVQLPGLLSAIS